MEVGVPGLEPKSAGAMVGTCVGVGETEEACGAASAIVVERESKRNKKKEILLADRRGA